MENKPHKKKFSGTVVSDKMDKTVVVKVETKIRHPLYTKYMKQTKKFKAHDENNQCQIGDLVEIIECRPISKDKKWRITEILKKGKETISSTNNEEKEQG